MKQNLFLFSWREFTRSASFGKSLGTKILLSFLALYFFATFFILGMSLGDILPEKFPNDDPVFIFNGFLLAYFGVDLIIRQLMQALPTIQIKPLLVINIKRSRIIRYLLGRSVFNFFNILPLFFLVPVCFTLVAPEKGTMPAIFWFFSLILLIISSHYLSTWLKWKFNESNYGFYVFVAVIAAIFAIDYFGLADFRKLFASYLQMVIEKPFSILAVLALPPVFYMLNFRYLKSNLYLNLIDSGKKDEKIRDFSWLNNLGEYGKFIALDLRLIWRNKRPRSQAMMTLLFLFYGLLIYRTDGKEVPDFVFVLGGLFLTSLFSISYGQFFPAWHSRYFPLLMTQNMRMKQFLHSFYILNVVICGLFYLLSLPYAFMHVKIIYIHLVMLFYNLGINIYLIFLFGLFSKKAVDLGGSSMFNYQGVGVSQWLMGFPLFVGPILLFSLLKLIGGTVFAFAFLGTLGLLGILLQPVLINYFAKAYLNKKHELIKNYKNS
ncbi:MAG: hypothetical protein A2W90_11515 [Bacteroidetes bacterium GWF2_42_66]|nr:MAG: hypothetical protein A2W92_13520 [Bacteroidetes bacterium GWA2_42_15]OFY01797.1 MAG: hypothetical protein A2W89_23055 [Bacteroidetes bacterium GWE2_42_39]OFY44909.1 MAG: hypothetical protein A2W90_11515 [Bacteroidetes bacterium GWF2_42_66]HBL76037.1 hypothetical protein [Prolixibacteraceae bacterium]HCR89662.1 hypothetical protein [Prolixibacteraceae bacterium]